MHPEVLQEYKLGDMVARYLINRDSMQVGFQLLPENVSQENIVTDNCFMESLIQYKLTGDIYNEAYAGGCSMRNGESVRKLKFSEQTDEFVGEQLQVNTIMMDEDGHRLIHHLVWLKNMPYVRISCTFENQSKTNCCLEMFESFSLGGLSPYMQGDGNGTLWLHRVRSVWSQEGRHEAIPVEDLQLEPAWDPHAVRCERFGQAGSMPVNRFFPFAAIEDRKNHVFWGAQIAHPASWQMEVYRKDNGLALSGVISERRKHPPCLWTGRKRRTMKTREQLEATGNKILNSVRTELYLSMRFMGPALGSLGFAMDLSTRTVGTDAVYIRFNPTYLLQTYIERPEILNRTYMHMLMHCLFRHMFSAKQHEDAQLWDLCCDIAVESVVDSMDYPTILRVTSDFRQEWYEKLEKEVSVLTAEKLYQYFMLRKRDPYLEESLRQEFLLCDHSFWQRMEKEPPQEQNKNQLQLLPAQTNKHSRLICLVLLLLFPVLPHLQFCSFLQLWICRSLHPCRYWYPS